jgi:membrane protease YdiL (CAAX protease family)
MRARDTPRPDHRRNPVIQSHAVVPAESVRELAEPVDATVPKPPASDRFRALLEVILCSSFPTQLLIAVAMRFSGIKPFEDNGQLSAAYIFPLALIDAVVLVALIVGLLLAHGESLRELFLGHRPVLREAVLGVWLIPAVFGLVTALLVTLRSVTPWLHNVDRNPMEDLIDSGPEAAMFAVVAIVAGGVREEVQRAFILHRFEQYLGGKWVGLVLFSLVFGIGHALQGWDAAITTGVLGALWGLIYLWRRSIVAPVVSHAGFNSVQIVQFLIAGR